MFTGRPTSYFFARRPDEPLLLNEEDDAVLHVGLRDGVPTDDLTFAPFTTQPPWSLEIVVKPAAAQALNAALIGNHDGRMGGFVVQQETLGVWALIVGDGRTYQPVFRFNLKPNVWNYLAIVRTQDAYTIYLDGVAVGSKPATGQPIAATPLPLQIGNWVNHDRPFSGEVKEVRILNRALTPHEIAGAADGIQGKLY